MNNTYIQNTKTYIADNKKNLIVGLAITLGAIVTTGIIALCIYNSTPKVIYQPTAACDMFNATKAKELLGNKTITSSVAAPTQSGDTASSNCGYTDGNPDTNNMIVAAISVRSGINDKGVEQNKTEFASGRPKTDVKIINNLGESAYFNQKLGQLNILNGHQWIIISYGVGSSPQTNTEDDAVKLARKIL
jgi:hypothetical protein